MATANFTTKPPMRSQDVIGLIDEGWNFWLIYIANHGQDEGRYDGEVVKLCMEVDGGGGSAKRGV
jgi:hypothetical protein